MKHNANQSLAAAHRIATWKVWSKHKESCIQCTFAWLLDTVEACPCLIGQAAHEEWQIAKIRHNRLEHKHQAT